jgi:branched-chain amino acid transport system ATP-binding protein
MTLLKVENLKSFYGPSQVLHGIDLTIRAGEQVALLGRNGMGKTTFFRSLMGAKNGVVGGIQFNGKEICGRLPEDIARSGVALVPEGRGIFGSLTVIENLIMAARPGRNGQRNWTLERVLSVFPRLAQRRSHGGQQLSGGEQQMLTIGRALMTNPELILIDEATEGLAPLVALEIWKTLSVIRAEGIATIVVDKNVQSLSKVADRMVIMSKGKLVFDGTPDALAQQGELLERNLGLQSRPEGCLQYRLGGRANRGSHWGSPPVAVIPLASMIRT